MSDEVLAWLSVCSEVQMICICSTWCHCHPSTSCFSKIQIALTFPVPAYRGCPEKRPLNECPSLCIWVYFACADHKAGWVCTKASRQSSLRRWRPPRWCFSSTRRSLRPCSAWCVYRRRWSSQRPRDHLVNELLRAVVTFPTHILTYYGRPM